MKPGDRFHEFVGMIFRQGSLPASRPPRSPAPWRTIFFMAFLTVVFWILLGIFSLVPCIDRLNAARPTGSALSDTAPILVAKISIRLFQAHILVALALAVIAGLLWALVRRRTRTRTQAALAYLALWTALTAYITARFLVMKPVFFETLLYAPGGLTRAIMSALTDHLTPGALDLGAAVIGLGLAGLYLHDLPTLMSRLRILAVAGLVGLAGVLISAAAKPAPARPDSHRKNILLIGVESLRTDAVSGFGYGRKTTPCIDRLMEKGVSFSGALVPLARTLPSWSSLLTGAYPHTHGHRHMFPDETEKPLHIATLPHHLARLGYSSAAVSDYAGEFFNLVDYGFHHVDAPPATGLRVVLARELLLAVPFLLPFLDNGAGRAAFPVLDYLPSNADPRAIGRRASRWVHTLPRPFLLATFISTPHIPYAAPYPYYKKFGNPGYEGPNKYAYHARSFHQMKQVGNRPPLAEQRRIRDLYDGAVHGADVAIGMILEALKQSGEADNTLVIVFGDHGERFFEGTATLGHGDTFRDGDAANQVPLILAMGSTPEEGLALPAKRVETPVSTVNLAPTVLDLLGLPGLPLADGDTLRPFWEAATPPVWPVFAETGIWLNSPGLHAHTPEAIRYPAVERLLRTDRRDGTTLVLREKYRDRVDRAKHRMMRLGRWKLVYEPTRKGARLRLFDAVVDPENRHDLSEKRPRLLRDLEHRLHKWMVQSPGTYIDHHGHLMRRYTYFE